MSVSKMWLSSSVAFFTRSRTSPRLDRESKMTTRMTRLPTSWMWMFCALPLVELRRELVLLEQLRHAACRGDVAGGEGGQAGRVDVVDVAARGDELSVLVDDEHDLGVRVLDQPIHDGLDLIELLLVHHHLRRIPMKPPQPKRRGASDSPGCFLIRRRNCWRPARAMTRCDLFFCPTETSYGSIRSVYAGARVQPGAPHAVAKPATASNSTRTPQREPGGGDALVGAVVHAGKAEIRTPGRTGWGRTRSSASRAGRRPSRP